MKRITLCTTLLMLIAGILITWGYERTHSAILTNNSFDPYRVQSNLSGKVELEFIRFISNQYHTYAQYKVTNGSSEIVYYPGEATNDSWMTLTKQDGWVKPAENTSTGNNFGTQSLRPGDSFIYDVQIPGGKGAFEIGFAYEVGNEHVWDIAWSGKIELPAK